MKRVVQFTLALIVAVQAVMVLFVHDYRDRERHFLTWDAYGYYLYLPGAFIYRDLDAFAFTEEHRANYYLSSGFYQLRDVDGKPVPSYTMGLAWLWLPFFAMAHAIATISGAFSPDGLSLPYQVAVGLASVFYLWLGFWCLSRWLGRYFQEATVALAMLGLYFGTNLFYYAVFHLGTTHLYLFSLYGALLLLTELWFERPAYWKAVAIGAVLAVMCLARPSEIVALILLLGFALGAQARRGLLFGRLGHLALAAATGMFLVFPQMLLWKRQTGQWIFNAYAHVGWGFDWLHPHLLERLFGYEKGWLLYTPLMALAVLGMLALRSFARAWQMPVILFFAVNLYMNCAYTQWETDTGIGMRFVVQSYAVLALPLGAALAYRRLQSPTAPRSIRRLKLPVRFYRRLKLPVQFLRRLKSPVRFFRRLKSPVRGTLVAGCIFLNLFQTWQLRQGILPKDHVNKPFYQAVFLKTKKDPMLLRYLDLAERRPAYLPPLTNVLAEYQWPADSAGAMGGQVSRQSQKVGQALPAGTEAFSRPLTCILNQETAEKISGAWVELRADVLTPTDRFGHYDAALLVLALTRPGVEKPLKWVGVHVQRSIPVGQWATFGFEVRLPENLQPGDKLEGGIWAPKCPDTVWVHKMEIVW